MKLRDRQKSRQRRRAETRSPAITRALTARFNSDYPDRESRRIAAPLDVYLLGAYTAMEMALAWARTSYGSRAYAVGLKRGYRLGIREASERSSA